MDQQTPAAVAGRPPLAAVPPATVPPPAPEPRKPARAVPVRTEEHAHLSLEALRDYRKALTAEESNVSYWRRIIQARLDLVRAGSSVTYGENLKPVLTDERVGAGRRALVEILPVDDIPPLPDLASLWDRYVDPADEAATAALAEDLFAAEQQLSEYRRALHQRLSAATAELIARYRDEPTLCLSALPSRPTRVHA